MEKKDYIKKGHKKRIHYYFLIDTENHLIPCEEAAEDFLNSIDRDVLASHILSMQLHSATIISTIILNDISYSLKVVPVSGSSMPKTLSNNLSLSDIDYIILVQNQFLFADLLHKIGKYSVLTSEFEDMIKDYDDAIYINYANGEPLYANYAYWEASGFQSEALFGENIDNSDPDLFLPILTPTVMKSDMDLTTFQHLKTGKDIITTGIPIYMSNGSYKLVFFLVSPLRHSSIHSPHLFAMKKTLASMSKEGTLNTTPHIEIIADSPKMKKCMQDAIKISSYNVPCLLLGSSGCGKEVFASLIHATSRRSTQPFVRINCGALPSNLLESELFGYEAGSFTGASNRGKKGFFESCNGGTLMLDEIGDMPLESQTKLLRVLETGEFYRVGGVTPIHVDVRIIAATNKNIKEMIKEGTFRNDLYHRLNVASLFLPDLKDRGDDISLFINHFTLYYNRKYYTDKVFSNELIEVFKGYSWPGNVRELKNVIERLVILSSSTVLSLIDIADSDILMQEENDPDIQINGLPPLEEAVDAVEKLLVERALAYSSNTRSAAELLNVSQSTIMRKIKKFQLKTKD